MRELDKKDLIWAVRRLPLVVKDLMELYPTRIVLGGGYLRAIVSGEKVNDLDLFTASPEDSRMFANLIADKVGRKLHETDNAYTIRLPNGTCVQFIHRWSFYAPEDLLGSFDFTIACSAIWASHGKKWKSLADDNFYSDLAAKRLVYRSPIRNEDAGGSLLRVLKYYQRGYRIPLDSLGAVLARTVRDLDTYNEKDLAVEITKLLVVVDPQVDPTHEAHLPADEDFPDNGNEEAA
jgi:hypothetical protein